jgi:hypothetical protein
MPLYQQSTVQGDIGIPPGNFHVPCVQEAPVNTRVNTNVEPPPTNVPSRQEEEDNFSAGAWYFKLPGSAADGQSIKEKATLRFVCEELCKASQWEPIESESVFLQPSVQVSGNLEQMVFKSQGVQTSCLPRNRKSRCNGRATQTNCTSGFSLDAGIQTEPCSQHATVEENIPTDEDSAFYGIETERSNVTGKAEEESEQENEEEVVKTEIGVADRRWQTISSTQELLRNDDGNVDARVPDRVLKDVIRVFDLAEKCLQMRSHDGITATYHALEDVVCARVAAHPDEIEQQITEHCLRVLELRDELIKQIEETFSAGTSL